MTTFKSFIPQSFLPNFLGALNYIAETPITLTQSLHILFTNTNLLREVFVNRK